MLAMFDNISTTNVMILGGVIAFLFVLVICMPRR
jgi:hypothetical protein